MAQANLVPLLTAEERKMLRAAFVVLIATQIRAAKNAKSEHVRAAYEKTADDIVKLEIKLFSFIGE